MESTPQETEFLKHLREEKLQAQEARTQYVFKKLAYATALIGIGSIKVEIFDLDLRGILYLVPFVALVFDFYIMGQDYSVKRLGGFLGVYSSDPLEHRWEQWVSQNRDLLAPVAMPILTTLLIIGSAITIVLSENQVADRITILSNPLFWIWAIGVGVLTWAIYIFYCRKRKRVRESIKQAMGSISQPIKSSEEHPTPPQ